MTFNPQQHASLQQLGAVPGVVGSLVFDRSGTIEDVAFPELFDRAGLDALAARLAGDAYFQEWVAGERGAMSMRFRDGQVTVRACGAVWLLVLATPQANEQLLSMSLTQVARRLAQGTSAPRHAETPPPRAAPAPSALDRLALIARAELGAHADQAVEILTAAGPDPAQLARAIDDVAKLVRLFIDKKKSQDIARRMQETLGA